MYKINLNLNNWKVLMSTIEKSYSFIYKNIFKALNPLKKKIIKTECLVHQFINNQAVLILKNDGNNEVYELMSEYIDYLNDGVVWADQDFKSSNHFYNPNTKRGLYGSSNAKKECISYYKSAIQNYMEGDIKEAMFYLGAACHLVQDLTVPQHANVELLHNHRSFENWVIKMYKRHHKFSVYEDGIYLNTVTEYIDLNSYTAINAYKKYNQIKNEHIRFFRITSIILTMAQKTTAGVMYKFFYDIQKLKAINYIKH